MTYELADFDPDGHLHGESPSDCTGECASHLYAIAQDAEKVTATLLTPDEHAAIRQAGDLWNTLCRVVVSGPTRDADLQELVHHVHAVQHAVMAQAAGRAYPDLYRTLGDVIT